MLNLVFQHYLLEVLTSLVAIYCSAFGDSVRYLKASVHLGSAPPVEVHSWYTHGLVTFCDSF